VDIVGPNSSPSPISAIAYRFADKVPFFNSFICKIIHSSQEANRGADQRREQKVQQP